MDDQKLVAVHHVTYLVENFPTIPKHFVIFEKVRSLVHFDYYPPKACLFGIINLNLQKDLS